MQVLQEAYPSLLNTAKYTCCQCQMGLFYNRDLSHLAADGPYLFQPFLRSSPAAPPPTVPTTVALALHKAPVIAVDCRRAYVLPALTPTPFAVAMLAIHVAAEVPATGPALEKPTAPRSIGPPIHTVAAPTAVEMPSHFAWDFQSTLSTDCDLSETVCAVEVERFLLATYLPSVERIAKEREEKGGCACQKCTCVQVL